MGRAVTFFKKYRWALLSGLLMGTSYIPFPPWALVFCWAPLWWDLLTNTKSPREAFYKAWWSQFVLSLIGFHWIAFLTHEFGFLPWPVAFLVLLLFAASVHLYIPCAAALAIYLKNRLGLSAAGTLIALATLHNFGEMFWPSVFSWNLGYPLLWIESAWAQWADVIGFLGLSYFVHLFSALLTWLWIQRNRRLTFAWAIGVAIFLGLTYWGGQLRHQEWQAREKSMNPSHLKIGITQANIGNLDKYYAERGNGYQREIIDQYVSLSQKLLAEHPDVDLLLWPESAIPEFLDEHNLYHKFRTYFVGEVAKLNKPVITGAFSNDPPLTKPRREEYNSMFLFDEKVHVVDLPYHKTQLLMLGEYVPFGKQFPILRKWNPGGDGFDRGHGPVMLPFRNWRLGPQICYESLDPNFSRTSALLGAQVLVNITNDSWFGKDFEPEQNLYMALARAIEVRRPLIRSTNTGISTAISAAGDLFPQSPKNEAWTGTFDLRLESDPPLTLYTSCAPWLPFIMLIMLGLILWRMRLGTSGLARNSQTYPKLRDQR